jgi:Holliday junction resolvasome RuvABC DNA-binding subunit
MAVNDRAIVRALAAIAVSFDMPAHKDCLQTNASVTTLVQAVLARGDAAVAGDEGDTLAQARQAVVQLGYPATVANAAVERARAHVDAAADLPALIKAVLRYCS